VTGTDGALVTAVRDLVARARVQARDADARERLDEAARRLDGPLRVAVAGRVKAGKSTLLNALVGSVVAKAEDRLFATLDPTSRQVKLGDGQTAIVTDTVGFIHKLPHQLVDAFRATLEEVTRADVLVEVVDAADAHHEEHRATVQTVLDELGAGDKPRLAAFNRIAIIIRWMAAAKSCFNEPSPKARKGSCTIISIQSLLNLARFQSHKQNGTFIER